jgi:RNA polymerase-binding transcription factor DksA
MKTYSVCVVCGQALPAHRLKTRKLCDKIGCHETWRKLSQNTYRAQKRQVKPDNQ